MGTRGYLGWMAETIMPCMTGHVVWLRAPIRGVGVCARLASMCACLLLAVWLVACPAKAADKPAAATSSAEHAGHQSYFMTTSQLSDPMRPFAHLPKDAIIEIHTAVVTVPDPLETRLGRAFDVEMSAMISAFQANGYVLDGFAFAWAPKATDSDDTYSSASSAREFPSVLLFRRDDWRVCDKDSTFCGSNYYALFLVGETPSSGVHQDAFKQAASCAIALDSTNRRNPLALPDFGETDCGKLTSIALKNSDAKLVVNLKEALNCDRRLNVIGPAFSGSMESMAAAINEAVSDDASMPCQEHSAEINAKNLKVRLLSPSASISDNENIRYHAYLNAANNSQHKLDFKYRSLAYSVSEQMGAVLSYLKLRMKRDDSVVVLSEESSFGQGARSSLGPGSSICSKTYHAGDSLEGDGCWGQLIEVAFPRNIASIRSEHAKIAQDQDAERRKILPKRLLELDLTGVDEGMDLPPTYQPSLSSRSDELMLYQTLDELKKRSHPAAAIIVATDVRDRLFLLSQIHDILPGVLPVVLEQDNLLVHPDYRSISRGSITMPAGRSLICLNSFNKVMPCYWDEEANGSLVVKDSPDCLLHPRHFAFATDYAANTFLAMLQLINHPGELTDLSQMAATSDEGWRTPSPLVATLAGFQYWDGYAVLAPIAQSETQQGGCSVTSRMMKRGVLVAADARVQLQGPVYMAMTLFFIGMIAVVLRLKRHKAERAQLVFPLSRYALGGSPEVTSNTSLSFDKVSRLGRLLWWAAILAGLGIAGTKVVRVLLTHHYDDADLAHGRALDVLIGLSLAYGCFIAVTMSRVLEWNMHCMALSSAVGKRTPLGLRLRCHGWEYAVPAGLAVLVGLYMSVATLSPIGDDRAWVSELGGAFALCGSVFFLVLFLEAFDRLCRISLELDGTVALIQEGVGVRDWPNPCRFAERPTSPFNIVLRLKDYRAWHQYGYELWARCTGLLLAGNWKPSPGSQFATWESLLVAEMKFAVTAMRTCAWCSVWGATLAALLIQVYPSAYPRMQITVSAVLLALGFASIIYVVLKLERDSLLGQMFTRGKDGFTFGNALSALWPKLLALASIVLTVFLPSVWDWVGGLVKAVNSLH